MANKMTVKQLVGMRVRDLRKERGFTQQQLADRTHLSLNMIGYVERGIKFPSAGTFEKLSKALNCSLDELFKSDPKDSAPNAKREALHALEGILRQDSPDYIRMVTRVVREMKKGGR